ncbi:MAG: hypothetical protein M1588_04880 [Planctomycetes bacterium]|jgi:hypothetical protein|nr:hypothetical protein [Planctomycetota bacterium]
MNLDRSVKQARRQVLLIGVLGLVLIVAGTVLLVLSISGPVPDLSLVRILRIGTPSLIIIATGLLIGSLAGVLYPLTAIRQVQMKEENWRQEQFRTEMETLRQLLEAIRQGVSISDAAKQIAYRHKDREALRHAIREDIDKNDYDAAYWLVTEMERRFGNRQEAVQFRDMIEAARKTFINREIREALDHLEGLIERFNWADSQREMEQLMRLFPDHPEVLKLPERIQAAREAHKRDILKQWKDAVSKDDVDRSVELLKQLDQYLTPGEAEGYKEIARDVFKKKLQQLGVQFALHVSDHNWAEALRIGRQIVDEFPNTRIAAEVRERLPILQEKAGQASVAI